MHRVGGEEMGCWLDSGYVTVLRLGDCTSDRQITGTSPPCHSKLASCDQPMLDGWMDRWLCLTILHPIYLQKPVDNP